MSKKISFGILCNSYLFEQWEANCIEALLQHPQIELKLLVMNAGNEQKKLSLWQKVKEYPYKHFLYRAYKRYFLKATSYRIVSLEKELKKIPVINCLVIQKGKHSTYFKSEDTALVQSYQLDFLLRFGFNIIKGDILKSSKYGVWSFHHADSDDIRGGPTGFWEIYLKKNTSAVVLQQLSEQLDQGKILRKGYVKTIDHSFAQQIDQLMGMSAGWPLQVCIDLMNGIEINHSASNSVAVGKLYKYPLNRQFINFLLILFINKFRFHYRQLFLAETWQIAMLNMSLEDVLSGKNLSTKILGNQTREYYSADPFLIKNEGSDELIFEYYSYREQIGKIGIKHLQTEEIKFIDFGDQIHRSYPFIIRHNGSCYCLPEQADAGKVTLYQLDKSGDIVNRYDLITAFAARDSTLVLHDNKWWLFCTAAGDLENASLHIFHSKHLHGPYHAHSNNPVKIDVRNARPAGNFFVKDGNLYRTAQNSALHYGHKVCINQVTCLNEISFKEELVTSIDAVSFGNFIGVHHIYTAEGQVLIDLKQHQFSWYNFLHQLKRKLRRLV